MLNKSLYSSQKMDWSTPQKLFDILNNEFKFSLDVCANHENKKCNTFYSIENNGLIKNWIGVVWMNPPYGREISKWIKKAYEESQLNDCVCVCLVPVRSDTKWWHQYVMRATEIRLLSKRLSFEGSNNKAPFPVAVVIFNKVSIIPKLTSMSI